LAVFEYKNYVLPFLAFENHISSSLGPLRLLYSSGQSGMKV